MNQFDTNPVAERIQRFDEHRRNVAATLRLPLDSYKVEQVAFLRLLREGQIAQFLSGKSIDVKGYLDLDRVLDEMTPTKPAPVISIHFTDEKDPASPAPSSPPPADSGNDTGQAIDPVSSVSFRARVEHHQHRTATQRMIRRASNQRDPEI